MILEKIYSEITLHFTLYTFYCLYTLNPNRSLGFMSDWYLFRADWPHHCRRRSGLRRDRDVDKMPKEMLIGHE